MNLLLGSAETLLAGLDDGELGFDTDSGSLVIRQGDQLTQVGGSGGGDGLLWETIPAGRTVTVPAGRVLAHVGTLEVLGTLVVEDGGSIAQIA